MAAAGDGSLTAAAIGKLTGRDDLRCLCEALGCTITAQDQAQAFKMFLATRTWEQLVEVLSQMSGGQFLPPAIDKKLKVLDARRKKQGVYAECARRIIAKLLSFGSPTVPVDVLEALRSAMQPKAAEQAGAKSFLNVDAAAWVPYQTHVHVGGGEKGGSSTDDGGDDEEFERLMWTFRGLGRPGAAGGDGQIAWESHFMCPVPGTQGTVVMIVNRGIDLRGGTKMYSLKWSEDLLFFVPRDCPVFQGDTDFARNFVAKVKLQHEKAKDSQTGTADFGVDVVYLKDSSIPIFDKSGALAVEGRAHRIKIARNFLTWEGMQLAVRHILCPRPGIYERPQEAEALTSMLCSMSNFFLKNNPADIVSDLITSGDMNAEDFVPGNGSFQASMLPRIAAPDSDDTDEDGDGDGEGDGEGGDIPADAPCFDIRAPAQVMSFNARLRAIAASMDAGAGHAAAGCDAHDEMRKFVLARNWGLMYQINALQRGLVQRDADQVNEMLSGLESSISLTYTDKKGKEVKYKIAPGLLVVTTKDIIELATKAFNKRVGKGAECARCYLVEIMTLPSLPPDHGAEEDFAAGSYSQARRNLFRHLLDTQCTLFSKGRYKASLGRPIRALSTSFGLPHSIADIIAQESNGGAMCSKYVGKKILARQGARSHILNVLYLVNPGEKKVCMFSGDNFDSKLKVGKNVGGTTGSHVTQNFTHVCGKRVDAPSVEPETRYISTHNDPPLCWKCAEGGVRPAKESPEYRANSQGGGLCKLCKAVGPPEAFDPDCVGRMKEILRDTKLAQNANVGAGILNPLFLQACLAGALGEELKTVMQVSSASGSAFATRRCVEDIYDSNSRAWDQTATYDPLDVDKWTKNSAVIDLLLKNSSTQLGLLQMHRLITTHPILGLYLQNNMVNFLSDSKCWYIVRRLHVAANIKRYLMYKVISNGLRGGALLDVGLHVIAKHSEWIFKRFSSIVEVYFEALVSRGSGQYFQKVLLSTRITCISVIFMAYEPHREELLEALAKCPDDPALQALVNLHEFHVPLCIAYHTIFKLGKSTDVEVRRKMFDIWSQKLFPLMIVALWVIGSDAYGKCLVQFWGDLLWWQKHDKTQFSFVRDNFANAIDGEFIELIHSWVSQNNPRKSRHQSDYEAVRRMFLHKDVLQGTKAAVEEMLGCGAQDTQRNAHNRARKAKDIEQVRVMVKSNIEHAMKEALQYKNKNVMRRMVPCGAKGEEAYESSVVGPVTEKMLFNHTHGLGQIGSDSFVDQLVQKTAEEVEKDLNSDEINAYLETADTKMKDNLKAAEDHFAEASKEKGSTAGLRRHADASAISKSLRFSVVNGERARQLVFGDEQHDINQVVNALVAMLPGGKQAHALAKQGREASLDKVDDALLPLISSGSKLLVARVHCRQPGTQDEAPENVEFIVGARACNSVSNFAEALQRAEQENPALLSLEPSLLVCGDVTVDWTAKNDGNPQERVGEVTIDKLHNRIVEGVQAAALRCLMLMLQGETVEAMTLSRRMIDLRCSEACDVIQCASNHALFMAIHSCAQTLEALYLWLGAPDGTGGDATPLVVNRLRDARKSMRDALQSKRTGIQPGFLAEGDAGVTLKMHVTQIEEFIGTLIDKTGSQYVEFYQQESESDDGSRTQYGDHPSDDDDDDDDDDQS